MSLVNVEGENAVLSGLFTHGNNALCEISDIVNTDTFSDSANSSIFRCMAKVLSDGNQVDIPSVMSTAKALCVDEFVRADKLKELRSNTIDIANVRNIAAVLRRLQFARGMQEASRRIYKTMNEVKGSEPLLTILSKAEDQINKISLEYQGFENSRPIHIGSKIRGYIEHVANNCTDKVGLSTPFKIWDDKIGGGLRRKCVDIIGARTGVGKSTFVDCVALHQGAIGTPVLILDTEMSEEDHFNRMVANLSGVCSRRIAQGQFSQKSIEFEAVSRAVDVLEKMPITFMNISGRSTEEIFSIARRWVRQTVGIDKNGVTNDALLMYDYIQTTTASDIGKDEKEYQTLGFLTKGLHNFAVEHDISVMAFVQLNRAGISVDTLDAVAGSDRISQVATSVSFLKEKSPAEVAEDGPENGNRRLSIAKARHGSGLFADYINLNLEGAISKLTELGTRNKSNEDRTNGSKPHKSKLEKFDSDGESDDF